MGKVISSTRTVPAPNQPSRWFRLASKKPKYLKNPRVPRLTTMVDVTTQKRSLGLIPGRPMIRPET